MGWMLPVFTIGMVVGVQVLFWLPTSSPAVQNKLASSSSSSRNENAAADEASKYDAADSATSERVSESSQNTSTTSPLSTGHNGPLPISARQQGNKETKDNKKDDDEEEEEENLFQMNNQWRCACEGGFLPPGMLKSFGGAEAMMRLGTGQCYHKQM